MYAYRNEDIKLLEDASVEFEPTLEILASNGAKSVFKLGSITRRCCGAYAKDREHVD